MGSHLGKAGDAYWWPHPQGWPSLLPSCGPGLAVGLDPQGYGNPDFCWLSLRDTLIWSFAGPIATVLIVRLHDSQGCGKLGCMGWRGCPRPAGSAAPLSCRVGWEALISKALSQAWVPGFWATPTPPDTA